jgi:hypothetical protein
MRINYKAQLRALIGQFRLSIISYRAVHRGLAASRDPYICDAYRIRAPVPHDELSIGGKRISSVVEEILVQQGRMMAILIRLGYLRGVRTGSLEYPILVHLAVKRKYRYDL